MVSPLASIGPVCLSAVLASCTSSSPSTGSTSSGGSTSGGSSGTPPPGAIQLGPSLVAAPTNPFRCSDGFPVQSNASFPQPFLSAGAPSCTLLTFLPPPSPSPGSGVANAATIRVGEVTGPMRFVRMRALYQHGTGVKCCSLEQYGETFTPGANAVTRVLLGFPMTEEPLPPPEDRATIIANDLVALEVLSPDVPIPGSWPNNGGADATVANYIFFPALSSAQVPAPSNQLLSYQGSFSGLVPSFQIEYVPGGR